MHHHNNTAFLSATRGWAAKKRKAHLRGYTPAAHRASEQPREHASSTVCQGIYIICLVFLAIILLYSFYYYDYLLKFMFQGIDVFVPVLR